MRLTRPSALQLLSRAYTQAWPEPAACWQLKSRRFHGCSGCETPAVSTTSREPKPEGIKRESLSHCTDVSQGCPYYVDIKLLDEKMDSARQVEMTLSCISDSLPVMGTQHEAASGNQATPSI
ncbi:hypothetical protein R6Z07F_011065 [Ovis aries]